MSGQFLWVGRDRWGWWSYSLGGWECLDNFYGWVWMVEVGEGIFWLCGGRWTFFMGEPECMRISGGGHSF